MLNAVPIFDFLEKAVSNGQRTALVTITTIDGPSTRNPGTHLAVAEDGSFCGSLSGGCIEAAVAAEAVAAIRAGAPRTMRIGKGSPWIDIRLPCGGGMELLVSPLPDNTFAKGALAAFAARKPVGIALPLGEGWPHLSPAGERPVEVSADHIRVTHAPPPLIAILGQGAAVSALARLAEGFGAVTHILSPDAALLNLSGRATWLRTPNDVEALVLDRWSACAFFFHEHEWEAALLKRALEQPAFYIGAMGSLATHTARLALLAQMGVPEDATARIRAPIGLLPSSRDPEVLALSTLAEIVEEHARAG